MTGKRSRVREPVQVYVDRDDRALLDAVAARTGLARAEVLRRGLRVLASQVLMERRPGGSLDALIGVLRDETGTPRDLAERHDEYLATYDGRETVRKKKEKGASPGRPRRG